MRFDKNEILILADLAKLNLSASEIKAFEQQLAEVLSYVDKIKKIKSVKIEASLSGSELPALVLRPDQANSSDEQVFKQANRISKNYLVAPNVFKK